LPLSPGAREGKDAPRGLHRLCRVERRILNKKGEEVRDLRILR